MAVELGNKRQGYALLVVVLMVAGLGLAAPTILQLGSSERIISRNYRKQIENYYLTEGVVNKMQAGVKEELQAEIDGLANPLQQEIISGTEFSDYQVHFTSLQEEEVTATGKVKKVIVVDSRLNINNANQGELTDLPGISNRLSARIIANREYVEIQQLKSISGVGKRRYRRIKDLVTAVGRGKINLNTASYQVLITLPDLGPTLAQRIIARRPFENKSELQKIAGIGTATYNKLKTKVKVKAEYFKIKLKVEIPDRRFTVHREAVIKLK